MYEMNIEKRQRKRKEKEYKNSWLIKNTKNSKIENENENSDYEIYKS